MPVLGSSVAAGGGTIQRGSIIPSGSLDIIKAALKLTGSQLVEMSFFGDSTTSGAAANNETYSWVDQVKARCIAAGVPFGGHGMFHPADGLFGYTYPSTEQPTVSASTPNVNAWTGGSATCPIGWNSVNAGESITFSFTGTQLRLMISYANAGARMSYSIDGGTAVNVETLVPTGGLSPYVTKPLLISGLSSGTHTLTVTNVQAATILEPVVSQNASIGSGGSLSNGTTYFYWLTATSASGESTPKSCGSVTATSANGTAGGMQFIGGFGHTGAKLYRSTTNNPTTAGLVKTVAGVTPAVVTNLSDDGTVTPAAAPPTTNTLGLYAAAHTVSFYPEFLHNSGFVCHRDALNGSSTTTFFDMTPGAASIGDSPVKMGLVNINDGAPASNEPWGLLPGTRPLNRNIKLVVIQLGTNDISNNPSGMDLTGTNLPFYIEQTAYAVRTARSAGADVVLIAPPYTAAVPQGVRYAGRYKAQLQALAQSYGVAYLDFQEPLGWDTKNWLARGYGVGLESNPHLPKAAYQAEGDFFFDRIIAPLL